MNRELLLLGLLRQQDMHGYQLHEFINRDLATCTDLKKATAYYLLNKMADRGWVTQTTEREGNRPPRQVYSLTPAGEQAFQRLLRENLAAYQPVYFSGDIGLAFLDSLPAAEALELLRARRSELAAYLQSLQQAPVHSGTLQWLVEHQLYHLQAEIRWLDQILQQLETTGQPE